MHEIATAQRAHAGSRAASFTAPIAAAIVAFVACAALAPAVVNGDGLGYIRAAPAGDRVPGHLLWLPLLRALAALFGRHDPLSLLGPARLLCWTCAALAAASFTAATERLAGRRAALVAALGMVGSFGFLEAGSDVETYAPALAAMCVALLCGVRRATGGGAGWAVATACAAACAALLHVENVLFIPTAALIAARPRPPSPRLRHELIARARGALWVAVLAGVLVVGAYATAAHSRGDDLGSALRWIRGSSHGFHYPLRLASPLLALYGIAKTLVYAPYPYESSWPRVIAQTFAGLAAAAGVTLLAIRRDRARTLGRLTALAWTLPYAMVGALFFASDNERWLFLLPPAWLVAGAGAATSRRATRIGLLLGATLLALNFALALPRARDTARRDRADLVTGQLAAGDLVVSPGHGWDEYLGFYRPLTLERFPLIYFAGQLGGAAPMADELRALALRVRAAGHRVWLLRGDDPASSEGWKDLAQFGVTRESLDGLLPGRRVAVAPGVERIEAATSPGG